MIVMADLDFIGLRAAVDRELAPLRRALESKELPMSTEADIIESFPKTNPAIEQEDIVALRSWGHRAIAEITKLRAERDAAARDMRERCAAKVEASSFRVARMLAGDIRALPDTPAMIATDREGDAT
jgi:hypothetical protein